MGRKQWLLLSAFVFGVATSVDAQTIISASRRIDWSQAGVPGGIPNRTTICATLNPGATAAQINSAIASCPRGQVVFLNAGTYNLSTGIVFNNKNNVTLRGAGPNQTFLVFTAGNSCGGLGGDLCFMNGDTNDSGNPRNVANWTAGYSAGTTSVTLGANPRGTNRRRHQPPTRGARRTATPPSIRWDSPGTKGRTGSRSRRSVYPDQQHALGQLRCGDCGRAMECE